MNEDTSLSLDVTILMFSNTTPNVERTTIFAVVFCIIICKISGIKTYPKGYQPYFLPEGRKISPVCVMSMPGILGIQVWTQMQMLEAASVVQQLIIQGKLTGKKAGGTLNQVISPNANKSKNGTGKSKVLGKGKHEEIYWNEGPRETMMNWQTQTGIQKG